jgi:hypothetical protein
MWVVSTKAAYPEQDHPRCRRPNQWSSSSRLAIMSKEARVLDIVVNFRAVRPVPGGGPGASARPLHPAP